jgi:hypothetical protein
MRDLKKYIRESILDDEDVLISGVRASANDLFTRMIAAVNSKITSYNFYKSLEHDNCIEWIYENFPSLKQFKLYLDLNNKNGGTDDPHGFNYNHSKVVVGVSMFKKSTVTGGFMPFDVMKFMCDTNGNITVIGKDPSSVNVFTYWASSKWTSFKMDLDRFVKKYNLTPIKQSAYLQRRYMQWGYTKKYN